MKASKPSHLGFSINDNNAGNLELKGAALDWVKPIDPFYGELVPIGNMTRAVHPNSAQLFIDFALSSEGQELFRSLGKIPARGGSAPTIKIDRDKIRMIPAEESVNTAYYAKLSDNLFVKGTR